MFERRNPRRPWLVAALTALAVLGAGRAAPGQQQDVDDDEAPEAAAQPVQNNVIFFNDQNFEQWVFGNVGNAAAGRTRLDSLLALKVDEVDRACRLTEAQKERLGLVGRGDVKRLFERVDEKRKAFQLVRFDQQKFQAFYQELQPLQLAFQQGPFDEGSLFSKAVMKSLETGQKATFEKARGDRRSFRYRAKLDLAVSTIDSAVGLTADQRRRLRGVLDEDIRPPRKFGPYDYYVIILQVSRLPQAQARLGMTDGQWQLLGTHFDVAKRMEPTLVKTGVLPDPTAGKGEPALDAEPGKNREAPAR